MPGSRERGVPWSYRKRSRGPVSREVLDAIPAQMEFFRAEKRPGTMIFEALLRRAGIRDEDLS